MCIFILIIGRSAYKNTNPARFGRYRAEILRVDARVYDAQRLVERFSKKAPKFRSEKIKTSSKMQKTPTGVS